MKHREATERLAHLANEVGVPLSVENASLLCGYVEWLLETNKTLNLTATIEVEAALRLHIVDSLTAVPELELAPPGELVDIGTGGGLPGVPLLVQTGRQGVLLDSVGKKARALSVYLQSVGLSAQALPVRSEELAMQRAEEFAVVVARAVGPLATLVELASPLLVRGGSLVCLKGRPEEAELTAGRIAAERVGLTERSLRELRLPDGGEHRLIIAYEKTGRPRMRLPRRPGQARTHPLA